MNDDKEDSGARDPATSRAPAREQILADIRKHRGLAPADYKFKRIDAYEDC